MRDPDRRRRTPRARQAAPPAGAGADVDALAEARDGVEALEQLAAFAPGPAVPRHPDAGSERPRAGRLAAGAGAAGRVCHRLRPVRDPRLRRQRHRLPAQALRPGHGCSARWSGCASAARRAPRTPTVRQAFDSGHAVSQLLVTERGVTRVVKVEQSSGSRRPTTTSCCTRADGQPLMRQTLAGLLDKLGPRFVRCHRRAAVQLDWIDSVVALDKGDCELVLRGGARVPCSRQYRPMMARCRCSRKQLADRARSSGSPHRHPASPHRAGLRRRTTLSWRHPLSDEPPPCNRHNHRLYLPRLGPHPRLLRC